MVGAASMSMPGPATKWCVIDLPMYPFAVVAEIGDAIVDKLYLESPTHQTGGCGQERRPDIWSECYDIQAKGLLELI